MFVSEKNAFVMTIKAKSAVVAAHIAMVEAGLPGMNDAILIADKAIKNAQAALHAAYEKAAAGKSEERQDHLWELAFGGME